MGYTIHSTADYHLADIDTLGWELTVCNALHSLESPCRGALTRNASYGEHLYDFLAGFMPIGEFTRIMEIGGGYGILMKDFLRKRRVTRATMLDISPFLLSRQQETLAGFNVSYVWADFLAVEEDIIQGHDLVVLNENLGDFPMHLDIDRTALLSPSLAPDPAMKELRRLFGTYDLEVPTQSPFHFNTGAVLAVEKLCRLQIPFIFIGEHSCEASVPDPYRRLIRISAPGQPERIALKGHDEYTIRFSHLERTASCFHYRVVRGPFADFLPFSLTDRLCWLMSLPAAESDDGEIIRHFIEDLFQYEYLILIREEAGSDMSCRRCGKCCLADFRSYVTDGDRRRWRREGRDDILDSLEEPRVVWAGDHFVSVTDEKSLGACSQLLCADGRNGCAIYETRPDTCRQFHPGLSEICPQFSPR
jgi:Fe-S-cluster containining protein